MQNTTDRNDVRKAFIVKRMIELTERHWIIANVQKGHAAGSHRTCGSVTSLELSVGYIPDGKKQWTDCEQLHYCHECGEIESESEFTVYDITAADFADVHVTS